MTSEGKLYLDAGGMLLVLLLMTMAFILVGVGADYLESGCATRPATCLLETK